MKEEQCQPIMERFVKRCSDWNERYMFHAAKETLVKSVLQALPTYCMGVFKMTQGFCDKYERLIRDFWWGEEKGHRKVHWKSWEQMTRPKRGGGIGFRDMKMFNQAGIAFITPYGPFCFNTMPFGLKNAGATYQRMIQTCLEK